MATTLKVKVNGRWYTVEAVDLESDPAKVLVDGEPVEVHLDHAPEAAPAAEAEPPSPTDGTGARENSGRAPTAPARVFASPMPGIIMSVAVQVGDQVVTGDEICVLEAMKMQQTLRAEWAGVVREVHVQIGQQMQGGDPIVTLE